MVQDWFGLFDDGHDFYGWGYDLFDPQYSLQVAEKFLDGFLIVLVWDGID
ncbi:hypothetical protein [Brevibacillus choshinensis]|nr:hypothetical protein [Brevibacillus choshinensis]